MKWMTLVVVMFVVSGCVAQQMDERNDPAMQLTIYTPHRGSVSKERQRGDVSRNEWSVLPFIAERYDHTNKMFGIYVVLHGNKHVLSTGAGGLIFTIDGKQEAVFPEELAHSLGEPSCVLTRCTVTWTLLPKTQAEVNGVARFIERVTNGHEVCWTLLPVDMSGGERFTLKLTDEQLGRFHDAQQYYDSLALVKKTSAQ